jgi:CBS domain containing-hemolysin-like protein
MTLILIVGTITLVASFLCSLFEAALYAVTPSEIELLKRGGHRGARRLERLRTHVEEPIAAILSVNTIAHTVGAAWCGAMVANLHGDDAMALFAAVFTFLVLALTEIIPKSLGVRFAAKIGPRLAWLLQILTWIAWPIARPTRTAMRYLTGAQGSRGPSEEEVLVFSELAARHGQVRREEHTWVSNALTLDKVRARDVMTPRKVVERMPANLTVEEAIQRTKQWVHSRIPIYEPDDPDEVCGVILRREVFDAAVSDRPGLTLRELARELHTVPMTVKAHQLLRHFLSKRTHLVALIDEYGSFQGIVTLEDVIESLLGEEIVDEHDQIVDLQAHARNNARKSREADD